MLADALLIIDYTNDFVARHGALTCGEPAQKIAANLVQLANQYLEAGKWVILPTDVHVADDPYHPETKLFATHNVRDSWGRELYGELDQWYHHHQNDPHVMMMDKTRYSSFAGTTLDLDLRVRQVSSVALTGVCTDICVLHTAVDAYNLGYQITVYEDAVATMTDEGQSWALNHFKNVLGAKIL